MPFKTTADISRDYKEEELKDEKWWVSYLRVREDLSLTKADIQRVGLAINDVEKLVNEFHSDVEQAFRDTSDKLETNHSAISKNYDKISETQSLIKDITSNMAQEIEKNHRAALLNNSEISAQHKDLLSKVYTSLSKKAEDINTAIQTESSKINEEIISSKSALDNKVGTAENNISDKIQAANANFEELVKNLTQKIDEHVHNINEDVKKKWWWVLGSLIGAFVILAALINLYKFVFK